MFIFTFAIIQGILFFNVNQIFGTIDILSEKQKSNSEILAGLKSKVYEVQQAQSIDK